MCRYFLSLLSCLYCHCYLGLGNAARRFLLLAGAGENWSSYMIPGHVYDMKGSSNNFYYR